MLRTKTVAFCLGLVLLAALASPVWAAPRTGADSAISGVLAWLDQLVKLLSIDEQPEGGVFVDPGHSGPVAQVRESESGVFVDPGGPPSGSATEFGGGAKQQTLEDPPVNEAGGFADPGG